MRFRRRFATGGRIDRVLAWLRARWITPDAAGLRSPAGARDEPPGRTGMTPRAASIAVSWRRWADRHRRGLVVGGAFAGTFVAGYLLAALAFFPAPIFAARHSVPRVLGLEQERAREELTVAGFAIGPIERTPHATVPAGHVVWQDPPPGMVAVEATEVALTVSTGPQRVPVPDVAGYDADDARLLLEAAGLRVGSTEATQAPTPRNVAVNTRPPAGSTLSPGTEVVLVVSVGAATIRVPTLIGMTVEEARLALETAGLALGTTFAQTTTAAAPREIFYQEPSAGTLTAPGSVVNVRLARSP